MKKIELNASELAFEIPAQLALHKHTGIIGCNIDEEIEE